MEINQQNISLLDFQTLQKQKFLPNWPAHSSGPKWCHF